MDIPSVLRTDSRNSLYSVFSAMNAEECSGERCLCSALPSATLEIHDYPKQRRMIVNIFVQDG